MDFLPRLGLPFSRVCLIRLPTFSVFGEADGGGGEACGGLKTNGYGPEVQGFPWLMGPWAQIG